jgi:four helix bundle protein
MPPWDLVDRTRAFALAVLTFYRRLPSSTEAHDAGRQLLRAATSTRSNYRAARKSRSRAAFRSKLQIAYEEADECVDWLEYMKDGRIQQDAALLQEAREIASILAVAVRTAGKNPTNQP